MSPGSKYYEWERRGVPVRLEIGPRDVKAGSVMAVRRFTGPDADRKFPIPVAELPVRLPALLDSMQGELLAAARERREAATIRGLEDYAEFQERMDTVGGFAFTGWCGDPACEQKVKEETKSTIRVIPDAEFRSPTPPARCLCGEPSVAEVVRARAY